MTGEKFDLAFCLSDSSNTSLLYIISVTSDIINKILVDFHSFLFSESEELSVIRVLVYREVLAIPLIRGTF